MKMLFLIVVFFSLNHSLFAKQRKPIVAEKCLVYKVVYNEGNKVDSVLLKQIMLNDQSKPLTEVEYSDGRNIQYKKEYVYKKRRLTSIILKGKSGGSEKTSYIYNSAGLLYKTKIYYDGKLSIIRAFSYDGFSNTNSITDYEYANGKVIFNAKEIKVFDSSNRIVKEIVVDRKGDTTFRSYYLYSPGLITYKAYGSDGKELESHKSFFNKDSIIMNKIFYKNDSTILTELYLYDSLNRLIKKQLKDKSENVLNTEEYTYASGGGMQRVVKNDYKGDRKEIVEYENEGKRIMTEEFWQSDAIVTKLYYRYLTLK